MDSSFLTVFDQVDLKKIERETIDSFRGNPNGRSFLAVTEILYKYGFQDHGIQLLMQGVEQHPKYSAARVVLAERLYAGSIFNEAWDILNQSPVSLRENKTAQLLKVNLALILNKEDRWRSQIEDMKASHQLNHEAQAIADDVELRGFSDARQGFLGSLEKEGFDLSYVSESISFESHAIEQPVTTSGDEDDPVLMERLLEGFYVAPISELFNKKEEFLPSENSKDLDAVTLAQIYRKQGRFQKSLDIYQRLLFMAPNNDLFKKQVEELKALKEEQENRDKQLDPSLVESLDRIQEIDAKISVLDSFLSRLEAYESKKRA